jgi:hypothetical protein
MFCALVGLAARCACAVLVALLVWRFFADRSSAHARRAASPALLRWCLGSMRRAPVVRAAPPAVALILLARGCPAQARATASPVLRGACASRPLGRRVAACGRPGAAKLHQLVWLVTPLLLRFARGRGLCRGSARSRSAAAPALGAACTNRRTTLPPCPPACASACVRGARGRSTASGLPSGWRCRPPRGRSRRFGARLRPLPPPGVHFGPRLGGSAGRYVSPACASAPRVAA